MILCTWKVGILEVRVVNTTPTQIKFSEPKYVGVPNHGLRDNMLPEPTDPAACRNHSQYLELQRDLID